MHHAAYVRLNASLNSAQDKSWSSKLISSSKKYVSNLNVCVNLIVSN